MDLGISGRAALVAASTSGLGFAIAQALAREGVRVVVNGRSSEHVDAAVEQIRAEGGDAVGIAADLATSVTDLLERAHAAVGDIDILVLNGGGPRPLSAGDVTESDLDPTFDSLLRPHVALINALLPGMRERKWGRIVAVGSSGIQAPLPDLALSNIGRAALAGYLKTLAAEVASDGVTVNLVLPGRIDTQRVQQLDDAAAAQRGSTPAQVRGEVISTIPAGRYGDPAEFGATAAFLCSAVAGYITGTALRVDGGAVPCL
ncbi:MAG: SDR family oxidoreductase [Bowdeniella nasicola]|nr:SDR family oxidoreductase [Bowdeniella nasicola]